MDINEILEMGKELTTVNEEDMHDVIFKKQQEIKNLLREKLTKSFEETRLGYLFGHYSSSNFEDALNLLRFFDNKFETINDYLQSNDPEAVTDEEKAEVIEFRDKMINRILTEVDAKLQEIK